MGTWNRKAPWDTKTGNLILIDYNYAAGADEGVEWRPADTPFEATLEFVHFERSRSAARAIFLTRETGGRVAMFLKDLGDLIASGRSIHRAMPGSWKVVKRGANYGIRHAKLP